VYRKKIGTRCEGAIIASPKLERDAMSCRVCSKGAALVKKRRSATVVDEGRVRKDAYWQREEKTSLLPGQGRCNAPESRT